MSYETLAASVDNLAAINTQLANDVVATQVASNAARDSAESYAMDSLAAATSSNASALLASNAAATAGSAAQSKVDILRDELTATQDTFRETISSSNGVEIVGGAYRKVANIEALRQLSSSKNEYVRVVRNGNQILNSNYILDLNDTTSIDDNGLVIVAADGGRWKLAFDNSIDIRVFGLQPGSDVTNVLNKAAMAVFKKGGGEVIIYDDYNLTGTISMLPHVTIRGSGSAGSPRITVVNVITAFETITPTGWVNSFCIDSHVRGLTLVGPGINTSSAAFSIRNAMQCSVRLNEIALFGYAFLWNKGTTSGTNFEQSYLNIIEQNLVKPCGRGHYFGGSANRNTMSTNSIADTLIAYDFGADYNYSETNTFINENIEGCHTWAEHGNTVYSQTWVGICIENASTNNYLCTVKDPGRQVFVNLSLIPLGDPNSIIMYAINDKPSMILGSAASSGSNRLGMVVNERFLMYDQMVYKSHHASVLYTGTVPANGMTSVSIQLPVAVLNDRVSVTALRSLNGCSMCAYALNGSVVVEIINGSNSAIPINNVEISARVEKFE